MRYPDFVRIGRATGSTTDPATGEVTPVNEVAYEGPADIQDEGAVVNQRVDTSEAVRNSSATIFLPKNADVSLIRAGDFVLIRWNATRAPDRAHLATSWDDDAEVVRAVRLDQKVFVRNL